MSAQSRDLTRAAGQGTPHWLGLALLAAAFGCSDKVGGHCDVDPCQNGAQCIDGVNQAVCLCAPGFTGDTCETNQNDCDPNPCDNGGTCTDGVNAFTCVCPEGYSGPRCEIPPDHCAADPCENGGTCVDAVDGFVCECTEGYTGPACAVKVDHCSSSPCENGGTCINAIGGYVCQCAPGYSGATCDTNIDDCTPNPCENGGTCTDGVASFACECPIGWTGLRCATDVDECQTVDCGDGICLNLPGSYLCDCFVGQPGPDCQIGCTNTVNFENRGTFSTPSLTESGVAITGSANLYFLNLNGMGIAGGAWNDTVDGHEWVRFDFAYQAFGFSYTVASAGNLDGDGTVGDSLVEGFDLNGNSLGTVPVVNPATVDVSALFGNKKLSAATIHADVDNQRLASVTVRYCP